MNNEIKGDINTYMNYGRESIEERIPDECDFNTPCLFCPYAGDCEIIGSLDDLPF